tara:strand:+ start:544 stop:780 length:237 start_codon:yes stop_codon:yes gene_type:complete
MKVKIDGKNTDYVGMPSHPIIVECKSMFDGKIFVTGEELINAGCEFKGWVANFDYVFNAHEYEIVNSRWYITEYLTVK